MALTKTETRRLNHEEAQSLTADVRRSAAALWTLLLRLYDGGAHEAMGYPSWEAYFKAEFGGSKGHAYRLLRAARLADEISVHVDTRGATEAQMRELGKIKNDPKRLAEVCRGVEREGGWERISVRDLRRIMLPGIPSAWNGDRGQYDPPLWSMKDLANQVQKTSSQLRQQRGPLYQRLSTMDREHARRYLDQLPALRRELDYLEGVLTGVSVGGEPR